MSDVKHNSPSLILGITIVAGTSVGAGMFALPLVSAGMWFSWSFVLLIVSWFFMYHSSLMILEANLNFDPGASFDTFVKAILGNRWNTLNNISLVFVLYILTYAYISGGGSIVSHMLDSTLSISLPPMLAGLCFAFSLAAVVWLGTGLVGRMTALLVAGMAVTFLLSMADLSPSAELATLLDNKPAYAPFILAAIPYYLTSFGYHTNVPSLLKFYGKKPLLIRRCLFYGSATALVVYLLWLFVSLGNIPRNNFSSIFAAGGNISDLVTALSGGTGDQRLPSLLGAFANLAVVSSFLGVTLGLFDFIADKFSFDDSSLGRLKTALMTFLPPTIGGIIFPNGCVYAIGLAGLSAVVWGVVVPALCAKASRKKYGNPLYRVWGGNTLIYCMFAYGAVLATCYVLGSFSLLPVLS